MSRSKRRRDRGQTRVGLPPGTAVYVGHPREGGGELTAFVYDGPGLVELQHPTAEEVFSQVAPGRMVWANCDGVHDVTLVTEICHRFGLSALALEDVLNTATRTKLELLDDRLALMSLEMLTCAVADGPLQPMATWEVNSEHVTLVFGPGFVLSFQEGHAGDLFEPVRQRIRGGSGRIRTQGSDYLTHALLDAIVDGYFVVLDRIDDRIEEVESSALAGQARDLAARVYALKQDVALVRRVVFPLREVVARLTKDEIQLVSRPVEPYLRDLYDHVMSVLEMAEGGRERLSSVLDLHLALSQHRMNDVMKLLTVVSTVFIPLSWVAGVYGMNFDVMPGIHHPRGFWEVLSLMSAVGVAMVAFFRFRRWL